MRRTQFRILYREFLFRIIDLDLLTPNGNMSKLLGQFAALLLVAGLWILLPATGVGAVDRLDLRLILIWISEHFVISTTMLAVGAFAVLSWESMFPDRRDVFVLKPLPIPGAILFGAKMLAVATALSVTVTALNFFPSLAAPFSYSRINTPGFPGYEAVLRTFLAYWAVMFASAVFVFCAVATIQGAAQLLPRQIYLRVSSFLQLGCFCAILWVYFLQPPFHGPSELAAHSAVIPWLPSYWFFAVLEQIKGTSSWIFAPLATRGWIGLAAAVAGAAASYLICYFRTLPKIAEQPDIQPAVRRLRRLPSFGNALQTAIGQFSVRTLFRSRQHRLILAFYLGAALGIAIFVSRAPVLRGVDQSLVVSSVVIVCGAVAGARVVFSIPLDLKANWIFQTVRTPSVAECMSATRRALYGIAVVPAWSLMTFLLFRWWPWREAATHAAVLGLLAILLAEAMLYGFHKIPFTCSYLPGKTYFHMAFIAFVVLVFLINKGASLEMDALGDARSIAIMLVTLAMCSFVARRRTTMRAAAADETLRFEEHEEPVIRSLALNG